MILELILTTFVGLIVSLIIEPLSVWLVSLCRLLMLITKMLSFAFSDTSKRLQDKVFYIEISTYLNIWILWCWLAKVSYRQRFHNYVFIGRNIIFGKTRNTM